MGRAALVLSAGLCTAPLAAAAFLDGPPPAHTGGFGEPSCLVCHFDFPPNPPDGALEVLGFPAMWEPGRSYEIRVRLSGAGLAAAGFQLSLRSATGDPPPRGTGVVRPGGGGIRVYENAGNGVTYAQHTVEGTVPAAPDGARWLLVWTAPAEGADTLVLNAATVLGNGDGSQFGDRVHLAELRSVRAGR